MGEESGLRKQLMIKSSIVNMFSLMCLLDVQLEMWSSHLDL